MHNFHNKRNEVCFKTRSTSASCSFCFYSALRIIHFATQPGGLKIRRHLLKVIFHFWYVLIEFVTHDTGKCPLSYKLVSGKANGCLQWFRIQPGKITDRRVVLCSSILEKIIYMRFSSGVRKLSVIWVSVLSGCLGLHCIRLSPVKLLKTRGRCLQLEEQNSVTN